MFIGHQIIWKNLTQIATENQLPSAFLFHGLAGIGKKKVALDFVEWLFKVPLNNHPDFYFVEPQGQSISIDPLRTLRRDLERSSLLAPCKFVVIDDAHKLTAGAGNSLLKTLEEPPRDTHFILITSSLAQILPTIRSRCRPIYFNPPALNESVPFISKEWDINPIKARELLEITEGSLGLAQNLMSEGFEAAAEEFRTLLTDPKRNFHKITKLAQKWLDEELDLKVFLEMIKKRMYKKMVERGDVSRLHKLDFIHAAQKDIQRNVNKALVLENLMMNLT